MILPFGIGSSFGSVVAQPALVGMLAASLATSPTLDGLPSTSAGSTPGISTPLPVLEVIKVYGKMAGPECFGKTAPKGSSCQVTPDDLRRTFSVDLSGKTTTLTLEEFTEDLNRATFQWPLKPYGIDKSLSKTATMNKGAETRVFMEELEDKGLYDKRNPTGPLPTSLRPQLNQMLQAEGLDPKTTQRIFQAMGGSNGQLQGDQLIEILGEDGALDFYEFLELLGKENVKWPY